VLRFKFSALFCQLSLNMLGPKDLYKSGINFMSTMSSCSIVVTASEPIYALQFGVTITEFVSYIS
jgi:hypothetical protein